MTIYTAKRGWRCMLMDIINQDRIAASTFGLSITAVISVSLPHAFQRGNPPAFIVCPPCMGILSDLNDIHPGKW